MQKPKTIAYLRVSTDDQDIEKNKFDILHLANEKGFELAPIQWFFRTLCESGSVEYLQAQ